MKTLGRVLALSVLSLVAVAASTAVAEADVVQIGSHSTDVSDGGAFRYGVQTTMTQPGGSQLYDSAAQFYWAGLFFPDGAFYQVGYAQHYPNGCSGNQWFVYGFDSAGNTVTNSFSNSYGICGYTGTHQFKMDYRNGIKNAQGLYIWSAYADNNLLQGGNFYTPYTYISGSNLPYAISELSVGGSAFPDSRDTLPGVRYYPATQVRTSNGWKNTGSAAVHRQGPSCPGSNRNAFAEGFNNIRAGSGYATACQSSGASLW